MKSRRLCREAALQALYQCDTLGDFSLVRFETFLAHFQLQNNLDSEEEGGVAAPLESGDPQLTARICLLAAGKDERRSWPYGRLRRPALDFGAGLGCYEHGGRGKFVVCSGIY